MALQPTEPPAVLNQHRSPVVVESAIRVWRKMAKTGTIVASKRIVATIHNLFLPIAVKSF
ncbi:MAG: hypothetical protein FGF51_01985 [Candidatus Brockarchaeota archaeon]|nr:hypothetical protein [Candidatus Brockarchaeota archaeon]